MYNLDSNLVLAFSVKHFFNLKRGEPMKKFAIALISCLLVAMTAISQEYWHWQNPIPQGNQLHDLWVFDSQHILAVGEVGTVIKTTDGGANWSVTHYNGGMTNDLYTVFFIDQNTGWAAGNQGKILHTTNGGNSWSVHNIFDSLEIKGLFFQNNQTGWAVGTKVQLGDSKGVILNTTDGGVTWSIKEDTDAKSLNAITFFSDKVGWAVGSRYQSTADIVLRTEDGGVTWTAQYPAKTTELYSACFVDSLHGWAVGDGLTSSGTILYTEDSGISWVEQPQPLATSALWGIAFKDRNTGWAVGEKGTLLKTENGGTLWVVKNTQVSRNLNAIKFNESEFIMSVGNAGLMIKSEDNGSVWQEMSSGTTMWHFYAVDFTDPDTGWIVGPNKTIIKSIDGGIDWVPQASSAPQNLLDIYMVNNITGWTVGEWGVILKTTDGGINWVDQSAGTNDFLHSCYFLNDQVGWVCGGPVTGDSSIIIQTTNGGNNWSRQNCSANASLRDIYFIDNMNGWAVGESGNVVQTTDGGATWSLVPIGRSTDFYSVFFISENIGWIGGNSILHTTDGGNTWSEQKAFSPNDQVRAITFIDLSIGWAVIQGNSGHLYKTMDGGVNWFQLEIGSANNLFDISIVNDKIGWIVGTYSTIMKTDAVFVPVELVAFNAEWNVDRVRLSWTTATESNNYGFEVQRWLNKAGSWQKIGFTEGHGTTSQLSYYSFTDRPKGGGKYSYRLKQIDIDGKFSYSPIREVSVPIKFALYQNHPNPFNPETEISFELPVNAQVSLEIYNMLGQKIITLLNEQIPAGYHRIIWNGKDNIGRMVGSGVYFYHIKTEGFEATKKLVLLR